MRILAVRGANIASLESFEVDLRKEPLRSAGIFAVVGPTGAGKSTLLDAMCLALYHQVPRLEGVSAQEAKVGGVFGEIGQNDIRNLIRRGCSTGFAECDFAGIDGAEYRARWGWRAGKRSGAAPQEEVSLSTVSDAQVLENAKKGCQERVVALAGLSFEQFTRTVLLAQGRFAEFLRAKSDERAELLEKLTGTEIYSRISRGIFLRKVREESVRRDLDARLSGLTLLAEEDREFKSVRSAELAEFLPGLVERERAITELLAVAADWRTARNEAADLQAAMVSAQTESVRARSEQEEALARIEAFARGKAERQDEIDRAVELDVQLAERVRRAEELAEAARAAEGRVAQLLEEVAVLEGRLSEAEAGLSRIRAFLESRSRLSPVADDWGRCREILEQAGRAVAERTARRKEREGREAEIRSGEPRETELSTRIRELSTRLEGSSPEILSERRAVLVRTLDALVRARKLAQLHSEERALVGRQGELDAERPAIEADLKATEPELATTRRLLDGLRLALSENVQHLRERLVEGEECSVCGSVHHPRGSGTAIDPGGILAGHEVEVARLERLREDLRGRQARTLAESEQIAASRRRLERERSALGDLPPDLVSRAASAADPHPGFRADEDSANAEIARIEDSLAEWHRKAELDRELSALGLSLGIARQAFEAAKQAEARADAEFAERAGSLDGLFGGDTWRVAWEKDPVEFRTKLDRQVAEFLESRREQEVLEVRRDKDSTRKSDLDSALVEAREKSSAAAESGRTAQEHSEECRVRRAELLAGRPVSEVREELREREDALSRGLESARSRRIEADRVLDGYRIRMDALRAEEERTRNRLATEGASQLEGTSDPEQVAEGLERAAPEVRSRLEADRTELARLEAELALDREAVRQAGEWRAELERQSGRVRLWATLSDAIGSADGKAFRVVAQRHTLEILLEEANRELERITPRYRLRPLPGTMHFGVVDSDAFGELRPVHTLSGGETFVVSLALALGLSRMAGGDVRVESLFVDEGFGALDPASLRSVMSALSHLHAQGRQVGVVTHVEEMKDQIPVRIEVERVGPGRSAVTVRG